MTPGDDPDRSWLAEPIGPNDLRIHVEVGEGVHLSDEARAALDTLLEEMYSDEVAGFAQSCGDLSACNPRYECFQLGGCNYLSKRPCAADVWCQIGRVA